MLFSMQPALSRQSGAAMGKSSVQGYAGLSKEGERGHVRPLAHIRMYTSAALGTGIHIANLDAAI